MPLGQPIVGSAASWGTEYSLFSQGTSLNAITSPGVYEAWIDAANIASGDQYTFRAYEKVRTGGTKRLYIEHQIVGVQTPAIWIYPGVQLHNGFDYTLQCTSGTNTRSIDYSIRRIS